MYPTHGEQQQEEIKTIRKRTIELELSDADVQRISEKAGAHGLTVGKLLESFIGDLVCGTYSNGSDERDFAGRWFNRCWFGMFPDMTFLRYLIEWGSIEDALENWDSIAEHESEIKAIQEALESGEMKSWRGDTYTWKDLVNGDDTPCYSTKEEWETEKQADLEYEQEELKACKEQMGEYWKEYSTIPKEYKQGSYGEEMKKVLEWRREYQRLLESGEPEQEKG